MLKGDIYL